jgi:hypothetical protein
MIYQYFRVRLQETLSRLVLKESFTPQQPNECFLNPPCGCSKPGKSLECEDCPYLEACLSQFKRSQKTLFS